MFPTEGESFSEAEFHLRTNKCTPYVQFSTFFDEINVNVISNLSMGIGTALAAIAGIQITAVYHLSPFVGVGALVTSILVITLGGMGSIIGAFIAAFIIGSCDSFGAVVMGRYHHLLSFGTVMIILLVRPLGLLGTPFEAKGKGK